jgi:putative flippase GtrA
VHSSPSDAAGQGPRTVGRFLRFALVGASGVVVNAVLLLLLVERLGVPVLLASLLSIEVSTLSNWSLNRAWTWRDRREPGGMMASLGRYHAVAVGGMALQWTVLGLMLQFTGVHYLVGSLAGVAVGTLWNFLGNDKLAFALQDGASSRARRVAWYATSFLLQLAIAAVLTHPWDTFVFSKSVGDFLVTGVTPYEVAAAAPGYIYPGGTLPLTAQWYAYPPLPLLLMSATYAPVAFGAVTVPWLGRILLKLPFLLGTLGFAWAARRLVAGTPGADPAAATRLADRAERWILLNPLFLVIAGVWGQFEALLLMLLALAVLALRSQKAGLAGLAYGGALLLKIFPLYVGPILLIHLVRTTGWRSAFRFFGAAAAAFAVVTLPFLLLEPHGTLQQIFLMHAERPPARFSPVAALYLGSRWLTLNVGGLPSVDALADAYSRLSFALTVVVLSALAAAYGRRQATERNLLLYLALAMTGGLLATKVLNEQYTLLPLGLLALAHFHGLASGARGPRLAPLLTAATWAMTIAALIDNVHFLRFLPPDIAARLLDDSVPVATRKMADYVGLSVANLRHVLGFVTGVGLVVPLVLALKLLAPPVRDGLVVLEHGAERIPALLRAAVPGRALVAAGALLVLIALPLSAALAPTAAGHDDGRPDSAQLPDRAVLAELRTDWYNPTNDPALAAGTWSGVDARPLAGHYNTNARKSVDDLAALRAAGADGILVRLDPDYTSGASAVRRVAESVGMPYGLAIDLRDLADDGGRVHLDEATAQRVRALLAGPNVEWWNGDWHLLAGDSRVVAIRGMDAASQPGFTSDELRLALRAYQLAHGLPDGDATLLTVAAAPPASVGDLVGDSAVQAVWREAVALAPTLWWAQATRDAAPVPLAFVTDAALPAGAGLRWLGDLAVDQPAALDGLPAGTTRWATLEGELTVDSLRPAWLKALWAEPTAVVVPWNDFAARRAVEPAEEHGDVLLRATGEWAERFHHPERPAEASDSPAGPQDQSVEGTVREVRDEVIPPHGAARSGRASDLFQG